MAHLQGQRLMSLLNVSQYAGAGGRCGQWTDGSRFVIGILVANRVPNHTLTLTRRIDKSGETRSNSCCVVVRFNICSRLKGIFRRGLQISINLFPRVGYTFVHPWSFAKLEPFISSKILCMFMFDYLQPSKSRVWPHTE